MLAGKFPSNVSRCAARCLALAGLWIVTSATSATAAQPARVAASSHLASAPPLRTWTDATGEFAIRGSLFQTGRYAVRLLKEDGRTCALPIQALSRADQLYLASHSAGALHNPRLDSADGLASLLRDVVPRFYGVDESNVLARLRVSGELMDRLFARNFTRHRAVQETIVGTPVTGHSQTVGSARVKVAPGFERAVFIVPISGVVTSQTTGHSGPVQVHGRGYSPFTSSVRVELDHRGIRVVPGMAEAQTHSTVTGISTSLGPLLGGLVTRAAQRRVAATRGQAQREAARIVERQINETVANETDQSMDSLRRMAGMKVSDLRQTAERFGVRARFSTTHDNFFISLVAREGVPHADSPPPPLEAQRDSVFIAQLHVSLVEKAMRESDQLDTIAPVIERLLAKNLEPIVKAQEFFKSGSVDMQWSSDEQWLTVSWIANGLAAAR